jgi:hypothetical protein
MALGLAASAAWHLTKKAANNFRKKMIETKTTDLLLFKWMI